MGTGVSPKRIATRIVTESFDGFFYSLSSSQLLCFFSYSHTAFFLPLDNSTINNNPYFFFPRKEVIQPHLPIRLPCYDFTPVIGSTFDSSLLAVGSLASGISNSHGVTGGVYKTRERIHRDILIRDY